MTYAPVPGTAPLPVEHARAARRAGALGGALVGVGLPIALSPAFAWASSGLYAWVASLPQVDPDGEMDAETRAVFTHMLELMASPLGIVLTVVCVLVGAALVTVGIRLALAMLRRAGVHRPVAVVLVGLLLARVGTWIVGAVLGGLPEALFASWFMPLIGLSFRHVYGETGGAAFGISFAVVSVITVLVGLVAAAGSWLGIGILTTWWMASALRQRVPVVVAMQPWPVAGWPAQETPAPRSEP